MKIISWNVNGLRSVYRKGLFEFLKRQNPDIVCFQEIKVTESDLPAELMSPFGYSSFYNPADKKGYSGTAVYTKPKPKRLVKKIGFAKLDQDGRFILLEFPNFMLVNLYMPHGGRQKENFPYKFACYKALFEILEDGLPDILIGDFNIAHTELDLARPKGNRNNTMFTGEEREQIDKLLSFGYKDSFRIFIKEGGHFTWWPYRNNLRERNIGWRIDYSFVSKRFVPKIKDSYILKDILGSDHCPIVIEI